MPHPRHTALHRRRKATWPNRGLAVALAGGGALLGWWLPRLERSHSLGGLTYDPATAQATSGAIAAGAITLTGFVLTAVTLVIQSVQSMSPRLAGVLGYFERSLVLFGALTGTAVYTLVVLAQVRDDHASRLSVTLAIVFVVLSTAAILRSFAGLRDLVTGGGLVRAVGQLLHTALDQEWHDPHTPPSSTGPTPLPHTDTDTAEIPAPFGGIVQHIDASAIMAVATRLDLHVTCLVAVGSFVEPGAPLLRVSPAPVSDATVRSLTRAVHLGPARRIDHDPAYGLRLLVDVAIRALSPAVNDPTTAVQALDQIESALLRLPHRALGPIDFRDEDDTTRLALRRPDWHALLDLALAEIILYGADSLQVHRRLRALLAALAYALPSHRATSLIPFHATLDHTVRALPTPALADIAATKDPQGLGGPA
ncbi:DUF2254 family protein [Streptomyces sp. BK79]|uniref:DUF2254 family protein n=1 Tax=Streptomyces sp. BK79 TaxID=3350097 RepID=UPI00376F9BE3